MSIKKQLQSMDNKENSFRLPGGGAKPKTAEKEQQIVKFIEDCLQIGTSPSVIETSQIQVVLLLTFLYFFQNLVVYI